MITNKELNAVKLSPTKKDFYQIWNELLDTAGKISDRWDPVSTNESDPGIVLLKVLTAVADKLNYNIDVNTLEAFMPSAAQEESMRKLTEMLGYNMKYYQSATTEVKISYDKYLDEPISGMLTIDKFTNLKDIDDSINYITLTQLNLDQNTPSGNVECMEGELVECETADNNIVSIFHLDDNKRYFLPETQIAENGIFITNIENNIEGAEWRKVNNLNAQSLGSKVFKFGFDSQEGLPYIQFPDDISTIIEDGLRIKYVRTTGGNGNIAVNTLQKLTNPLSWSQINPTDKKTYHDADNFTVTNIRAATNGANRESINAAYNNFKKTVGTFDTLVTCRDYMNKIYQLVSNVDNTTPLVSNVIVSDIKSDINRAITLGTFTNRGIEYKVMAKPESDPKKRFTNFDLILYPFKSVYGLNSQPEFEKSFKYDSSNHSEILANLEDCKTLAHNFIQPANDEIACIKNYYKLRAKINTVRKVGSIEQVNILNSVYKKLFETFNMRQLDFGEEIPYDTILKVIETADPRIKNISLDEPILTTKFAPVKGEELDLSDDEGKKVYNQLVLNNGLAGRVPLFNYNSSFSTDFTERKYPAGPADCTDPESDDITFAELYPNEKTLQGEIEDSAKIHKLRTEFYVPADAVKDSNELTLTAQEVIQFKAPNFTTTTVYPAFVNYYFYRDTSGDDFIKAIPATMQTLGDFLMGGPGADKETARKTLEYYVNEADFPENLIPKLRVAPEIRENITRDPSAWKSAFDTHVSTRLAVFVKDGTNKFRYVATSDEGVEILRKDLDHGTTTEFYALLFEGSATSADGIISWRRWLINRPQVVLDSDDSNYSSLVFESNIIDADLKGLYKHNGSDFKSTGSYLVDRNGIQFKLVESPKDIATVPFNYYYVPRIWHSEKATPSSALDTVNASDWHTKDGLGQNATAYDIDANTEYELRPNEYLLIHYVTSANETSDEKVEVCNVLKPGDIIKPNFRLADSETWHKANHSYTKLNVADKFADVPIKSIEGMFTLGTNEQIEVRDLVQVELDSANTNLYWVIPGLVSTQNGYLEFPFDEEPISLTNGQPIEVLPGSTLRPGIDYIYSAYTLKEGESLYYTDMNKSNIAMYGFGTTIKRGLNTPTIFKYIADDVISTSAIATNGLSASIPWRNYKLNGPSAAITVTENQFINLTEGDTLVDLDFGAKDHLTNSFIPVGVTGASWKLAEDDGIAKYLPSVDLVNKQRKWQVRSKLNLALGPNQCQTLRTKAITGSSHVVQDRVTLINTAYHQGKGTDTELLTLRALTPDTPLALKANQFVQSAATVTDVTDKPTNAEGALTDLIKADLQLKVFENHLVLNNYGQIINFGNYGDGKFTTINFEEQLNQIGGIKESPLSFDLNLLLPEDHFGLIMLYYDKLDENVANVEVSWTVANNIKHFNEEYPSDIQAAELLYSSHADYLDGTASEVPTYKIPLREGINVLKVNQSDVLTISSDNDNRSTITFSSLDVIPVDDSINPKLCYNLLKDATGNYVKIEDTYEINTVEKQLLADIHKIDTKKEFYYNIPIAQNLDIDMNPNDPDDNLSNPLNWFNYNNINNKFVISEIDTTSLTDDIVIAKSSRSNY